MHLLVDPYNTPKFVFKSKDGTSLLNAETLHELCNITSTMLSPVFHEDCPAYSLGYFIGKYIRYIHTVMLLGVSEHLTVNSSLYMPKRGMHSPSREERKKYNYYHLEF